MWMVLPRRWGSSDYNGPLLGFESWAIQPRGLMAVTRTMPKVPH